MIITLSSEGVPTDAYEVIVYAKVASGYNEGQKRDGELIVSSTIPNGRIERKVFCRFYAQSALSYNSENICLPLGGSGTKTVTASLNGPNSGNFNASVTVVGYHLQAE